MSKKLNIPQNWKLRRQCRAVFRNAAWNMHVSHQTNLNNSAVKISHITHTVHAQCSV